MVLASIVQEETPLAAELPKIAAVYENRLAMGMKLQADPTVIFAATGGAAADGLPIFRADLANASPYNTYVVEGLPPGPICSPGLAAIQAVLRVRRPGEPRVLFIGCLADTTTAPAMTRRLFDRCNVSRERRAVWFADRAGHIRSFETDPAGFERRVVGFLEGTQSVADASEAAENVRASNVA